MMEGCWSRIANCPWRGRYLYRNEETLERCPYFPKLVSNIDIWRWSLTDATATGGSMIATIDLLKNAGYQHQEWCW